MRYGFLALAYALLGLACLAIGLGEALFIGEFRGPMETFGGTAALVLLVLGVPLVCFIGIFILLREIYRGNY